MRIGEELKIVRLLKMWFFFGIIHPQEVLFLE